MERVGSSVGRADAETPATDAKLLKLALMWLAPAAFAATHLPLCPTTACGRSEVLSLPYWWSAYWKALPHSLLPNRQRHLHLCILLQLEGRFRQRRLIHIRELGRIEYGYLVMTRLQTVKRKIPICVNVLGHG
jgi:hypothetical protein